MGTGSMEAGDKAAAEVQKTPNRVGLENIKAKIKSTDFIHPEAAPHVTIAALVMENGFVLVGKAAPADPENFDAEVGRKFAYEDALRQAWPLEGYLLREKLWNKGAGPAGTASEAGPNPQPEPEPAAS